MNSRCDCEISTGQALEQADMAAGTALSADGAVSDGVGADGVGADGVGAASSPGKGTASPEKNPAIDDLWLKAAVAGGLWAAVEIILGSFLHNLRVPMAGSILASFGILLMTAFFQIWPERGLIWRAGLICALMKSISPSAVILGPMTGIMLEALLLEGGIRLLGRNPAGYLAGGALALLSALMHKIVSLTLIYGFNIITIYLNLFYFASAQINIPEVDPWQLIIILGGLYLFFGSLAAFAGYVIGQRSLRPTGGLQEKMPAAHGVKEVKAEAHGVKEVKAEAHGAIRMAAPGKKELAMAAHGVKEPVMAAPGVKKKAMVAPELEDGLFEPPAGRFSVWLFALHLSAIPGGLLLINNSERLVAYPLMTVYTIFCLVRYRNTIRRFKKPLFWFQLLVIAMLAAIFLENFDGGSPVFNWNGILAGLDMNIRAMLVVAGFSALSTELRNPLITAFLVRRGFRQLYLSISMAFRALPAMMQEISRPGLFLSSPFSSLRMMVANARSWLEILQKEPVLPGNKSFSENTPD